MSTFEVLEPGGRWPSDYLEVAVLPVSDQEVSRVFATELIRGIEDGLGEWRAVGFRLLGSDLGELIHYPSSPGPAGYILRLDRASPIEPAFSEVLSLFGLQRSALLWVASGA